MTDYTYTVELSLRSICVYYSDDIHSEGIADLWCDAVDSHVFLAHRYMADGRHALLLTPLGEEFTQHGYDVIQAELQRVIDECKAEDAAVTS